VKKIHSSWLRYVRKLVSTVVGGMHLEAVANAAGISKPSAKRILVSLCESGKLVYNAKTDRWDIPAGAPRPYLVLES
jgi:DNA-binding IclR family transcriptional regulator